jgi:uncharacterized phage protein (predicted DNA packaging)
MSVVTLSEAKLHLRVTQNAEDSLIKAYIAAAEEYVGKLLNQSNYPITAPIRAAVLLTVSDLYENRNGASDKDIKENPAVMRLLYPYRKEIGI